MSLNRNKRTEIRRPWLLMRRACLLRPWGYHARTFFTVSTMTEQPRTECSSDDQASTLYAKLLGETAPIAWQELQPFFARGVVLWVAAGLDLIAVALAVAEDDKASIAAWLAAGQVNALSAAQAEDLLARDPPLWAVVVAPWVLVQERGARSELH